LKNAKKYQHVKRHFACRILKTGNPTDEPFTRIKLPFLILDDSILAICGTSPQSFIVTHSPSRPCQSFVVGEYATTQAKVQASS